MWWLAALDPGVVDTAESLARLSVGALALLFILAISKGWFVTRLRHQDTIDFYERLLEQRDNTIASCIEEKDWWKDATVTALQIGREVADRSLPPNSTGR